MPEVTYECSVNNSHPQLKFAAPQTPAPVCCNQPMVLRQAQAPVPAAAAAAAPATAPAPQKPAAASGLPKAASAGKKSTRKRA